MQEFTIQISEGDIGYLKQRLANARWFNSSYDDSDEGGVTINYLKKNGQRH